MRLTTVACFAICVSAILADLVMAAPFNCSRVPEPPGSMRFYDPPVRCLHAEPPLARCITTFDRCSLSAPSCPAIYACFEAKTRCLEGTSADAPECSSWSAGVRNTLLYLIAGGEYNQSVLYASCLHQQCVDLANTSLPLKCGGDSSACVAPNFDPATRGPDQPLFTVVFAGDWSYVLAGAPIGSERYRAIINALRRGFARILRSFEHLIDILSIRSGSLVVEFVVNDPALNVTSISELLRQFIENPDPSVWDELAAITGMKIIMTSFSVDGGGAATAAPEEDACQGGCIAGAVIGALALTAIIVGSIIIACKRRNKLHGGTDAQPRPPTAEPHAE